VNLGRKKNKIRKIGILDLRLDRRSHRSRAQATVLPEDELALVGSHQAEEVFDGGAGWLGGNGQQRCVRGLAWLAVRRRRRRWWVGSGGRCLGPRPQVDVWKRVTRNSLVGALTVEVVDVVKIDRAILMSIPMYIHQQHQRRHRRHRQAATVCVWALKNIY